MGKKSKQGQQQQQAQTAVVDASAKKQEVAKKAAAVAPQEVAAVPGFFGHVVEPGQKLLWANEVEEFVLQLNSAALGASVRSGRSTLYVLAKESKIALCTLVPETTEQFALAHTFTPLDGEIEFVVEGVNAIHLTGFIDVQEDEDDEQDGGDRHDFDDSCDSCDDDHEGHSDDDSMDEDEEMMVFGDQSDSDDDENDEEDDSEDRFEVIEERVHGDSKKKVAAGKDEKKPAAKKQEAKKDATPAKKQEAKKQEAKKEESTPAPTKKEAAAAAKTEKKIAEKVAEVTAATAGKKRPAPSDSVDVPKKAKNSRVYKGVTIEEQAVGKGAAVMKGRKVSILYKGRLENGKQFDANQSRKKPFTFRHGIGDVIKGMDIGIEGMRSGGKRTILIPSKLGYGKAGAGPSIPGNANLIFDIEML